MQSFGELLRTTRLEKGIKLEKVSSDTNISVHFLEDLEQEKMISFPGEAYLYGFLHSYAEYLGLDPKHIIHLYRAAKKQEAPAPELLTHEPKKRVSPVAIILICSIFLVVSGVSFIFYRIYQKQEREKAKILKREHVAVEYEFTGEILENLRVYQTDKIRIPVTDGQITLTVGDTLGKLSILTPQGTQVVELGDAVDLDADNDSTMDISIFVSDISKRDPNAGAQITIMPPVQASGAHSSIQVATTLPIANESAESQPENAAAKKSPVIFESASAYPITLNISFRGECLFYYSIDNKPRVEKYYYANENITLQANNGYRLWMSNANFANIQVIGGGRTQRLEVGVQGQVLCEDIKWVKDGDKFKFIVAAVD